MRRLPAWGLLLALSAFWMTGCAPLKPAPPPGEILTRSAQRMQSLRGFDFQIMRTGAPAFFDPQAQIAFRKAEGEYVAPDAVSTTVRVIAPGVVTDVKIVSKGGQQWETNFLTGQWHPSDPRYAFNPVRLFDPANGIPAIMATDMKDVVLVGIEQLTEVPGKKLYAITATVDGRRAYDMTYGMINAVPLEAKIWIDPNTFDLYRIYITDPVTPDPKDDTYWQIDFWDFNGNFTVDFPPEAQP